jgi:hypothetical protein
MSARWPCKACGAYPFFAGRAEPEACPFCGETEAAAPVECKTCGEDDCKRPHDCQACEIEDATEQCDSCLRTVCSECSYAVGEGPDMHTRCGGCDEDAEMNEAIFAELSR